MLEFDNYMSPGRRGHLVGIGGVSMSSLAEVLVGMGLNITGSDMNEANPNVISLREKGIKVFIGHHAENIGEDVEFVVRTAAVHDENPEIVRAHELGIPVFERTQAWGAISKDYSNALCISGTHGKTTTTSMCTHILMAAEKDHPRAQYLLGEAYETGRGLEKDCSRALYWYKKAADNGELLAMDRLGQIYSGGLCFQARDQEEARRWRERSFRIRRGWVSSSEKP